MSTSPKSEPTILLWGDRWWLPYHRLPVPFPNLGQAADMLAAAWPDKVRIIRLLYQPDDFITTAVPCPKGNRATLTMALAEEHPVLIHPGHVWSHEPILAREDGYHTLLHYETRPALYSLIQQLEEHGFTVASVWPLATWLNALPPDLSASGAMTVAAVTNDRYCLYRHSADGVRTVHTGRGDAALPAVTAHLREGAAKNPDEFVLLVASDEDLAESLPEQVAFAPHQVVGIFTAREALAKPAIIPEKHPAQLLPPLPRINALRVVLAATMLCLALTVVGTAKLGRDYQDDVAEKHDREARRQSLRSEVSHLKENAAEIAILRAGLADHPTRPPVGRLLDQLASTLPPGIVLGSLQVTTSGFTVTGYLDPAAPVTGWSDWTTRLNNAGLRLHTPDKPNAAGSITLRGEFPG